MAIPAEYYLILSFALFLIGTAGVLLRRNALIVLMWIELQLNGGNLALLANTCPFWSPSWCENASRRGTCSRSS